MSPDGISISTSKWLRIFLNDFSKLSQAEMRAVMLYTSENMSMFLGEFAPKKEKKKYKIKADVMLFLAGKNIARGMTCESAETFEKDAELTIDQIKALAAKMQAEKQKMSAERRKLNKLHSDTVKKWRLAGVPIRTKKKAKKAVKG